MNTYIRLINNEGAEVFSNLPKNLEQYFNSCKNQNEIIEYSLTANKRMRHGIIESEIGTAYLISDDPVLVDRPRYFKEKLKVHSEHLRDLIAIKENLTKVSQADNNRLVHNITSINAHNIQEIYLLVPEDKLSIDYRDILEIIKQYLIEDTDAAAAAFLRIAKNSIAMKTEFTVFKKLQGGKPVLQQQYHDIRKVLLTVFHVFFQDFKELNVHVQIDECIKTLWIDFETIRVALYHFIDNTTKYILPNTQLRIYFKEEGKKFSIVFDMISMEIKNYEINEIFKEGISGENAKKIGKNGDGLGLPIVCNILELNDAEIKIYPNYAPPISRRFAGINYVRNLFEINFFI